MKRQSSHIKLDRSLVEEHGHFPAMVLDCLRSRIEVHLAADAQDDRYFREENGLIYVRASGTFISNWIMCDRSTATKALRKLSRSGVLKKAYLTGRQNGAWYAFSSSFIMGSGGFFDQGVKRHLIIAARSARQQDERASVQLQDANTEADPAAEMSPAGGDLIRTSGGDNIHTGADLIRTSADFVTTSPIYNTNNTTPHLRAHARGAGGFDGSFLCERDEPFRRDIAAALSSYPDEDPVVLAKDQLGWKTCRAQTEKQIRRLAADFGFEIFAASVVMAASEPSLKSPLSFIRTVAERLEAQRIDNERRREKSKSRPAPLPQQESYRSSQKPSEVLGGSVTDPKTWERFRATKNGA